MKANKQDAKSLPPRKVVVASALYGMWGPYPGLQGRLEALGEIVDEMARKAARRFDGTALDLAVLPEYALTGSGRRPVAEAAIRLSDEFLEAVGDLARRHKCYLVAGLHLAEGNRPVRYFNAALLMDRQGKPAGIYRYVHPSAWELAGSGISPGKGFPVFDCDFGRIGIQFCGEVGYADGWRALQRKGAELIAFPSQPPYPMQVAARAAGARCYVLSSTWRGAAMLHDPLGAPVAQIRQGEGRVLVERIDLSYAILGWQAKLEGGKVFDKTFGSRAGYRYYELDDQGIFWSNDPEFPIGRMVRQLKLTTFPQDHARSLVAQSKARARVWKR